MNISDLIKEYGKPDVWYDPYNNKSGFCIWDFEEEIKLDDSGCYINGIKKNKNPLILLQKCIDKWKKESEGIACVGFFSYNFNKYLFPNIKFKNNKNSVPYFWFGKPKNIYKINQVDIILNEDLKIYPMNNHESYDKFKINLNKIKQNLLRGIIYQVNYTYPKYFENKINIFDLYVYLRKFSKPEFGWFINYNKIKILSFSPERFFNVSDNIISSYPIKGTRARSKNKIIDNKLKNDLFNSNKDRAEHLMITDLLRNDLGKICEYESIKVKNLFQTISFETIHHMVSEIYGKLSNNIKETDIIKAMFPGGSITGAPKENAMKIIDKLENYTRGIYTGSIGYITSDNKMDFNIAIRTMTINNNIISYPVGGGIVWDSIFQEEWEETHIKTKILNSIINKNVFLSDVY